MKALSCILILFVAPLSLPAVAQEKCVIALRAEAASDRADASLRVLRGMLNGSSVNAGIAVDRILNEVQMRLAGAESNTIVDSFATDKSSNSAKAQSELFQKSIQDLEKSLEQKTDGFLARFRKNSLATQVKQRLEAIESGNQEIEALIDSVKRNIEVLRDQQLGAEAWEAKVNAEIDYLQEIVNRLTDEAFAGNASQNFIQNFNDEILPRLLLQANNLMSQQILMVKTVASGLKTRVISEQMTLENLNTLKNVSSKIAILKAKKFLGDEAVEAEMSEEQQRANELACQRKDFCAGETVAYFPYNEGQLVPLYSKQVAGAVASSETGSLSRVITGDNAGTHQEQNHFLARRQAGLSWKGFAIGRHVQSKAGGKFWLVEGIFSNGDLMLKEVYQYDNGKTNKPHYLFATNHMGQYNYIRLSPELVIGAAVGGPLPGKR